VPIAMTQEQQALQASIRDWAKHAQGGSGGMGPPRSGGGLGGVVPPGLTQELAAFGVFAILDEGGTVTDLAAALEQPACALAPGPVLPTLLASLVLARCAAEHRQAAVETLLELLGPAGAADEGRGQGAIYEFLLTRCLSIAGGITQILLNQVAERVLGLPKESSVR
jgi:Acyl-CoA dehydrogenase, C-terminal domain